MRALITPTTLGFRQALKEEGIAFSLPSEAQLAAGRKLVRTGSECSHLSAASEPPPVRECQSMLEPLWLNNDPAPETCDSGVGEEFK